MTKSYKKDIQILMSILRNQNKIADTLNHFNCNINNLDKNEMAFDLCAFYMAQIGEAAKLLTDQTKNSLTFLDTETLKLFRNMINHTYEKINKIILKAYIFSTVDNNAVCEVKSRIRYCNEHAEE